MMAIDEQQIRAIAFLAARCRPTGAKPWDEPGIAANLRKVAHIDAAEVILATIRAAANRAAESPGVIPNLAGEHWREKVVERTQTAPKRHEQCLTCGKHLDACVCGEQRTRPVSSSQPTTEWLEARAAMRSNHA